MSCSGAGAAADPAIACKRRVKRRSKRRVCSARAQAQQRTLRLRALLAPQVLVLVLLHQYSKLSTCSGGSYPALACGCCGEGQCAGTCACSSSGVSVCTFVLVKQVNRLLRARLARLCIRMLALMLLHRRRHILHFCTSKASNLSTCGACGWRGCAYVCACSLLALMQLFVLVKQVNCGTKKSVFTCCACGWRVCAYAYAGLECSRSCRCTGGGTYSACPCCATGGLSLLAFLVQEYKY